jgi:hypothetical protein
MIKEKIEIAVTVEIQYPTKADRKRAVRQAKDCVLSTRILSTHISCNSLKSKEQPPLEQTVIDFMQQYWDNNHETNGLAFDEYVKDWLKKYKKIKLNKY